MRPYDREEEFDEIVEMEWFYARRRRRQKVWAVIAVFVAVSLLVLYILADFFRLGRSRPAPPPTEPVRTMAPAVPGPAPATPPTAGTNNGGVGQAPTSHPPR